MSKPDLLMVTPMMPMIEEQLDKAFTVHRLSAAKDRDALIAEVAPKVRAIASTPGARVDAALMGKLPNLEIVGAFGVGYDSIDAKWAGEHGVVVTNTPDVLNEEVADTAIGLLLATIRQFPQADQYVRAGKWLEKAFPLTATLQDRTVGVLGMGRIGKAIAKRLEAFNTPIVYHSRNPAAGVSYKHYPDLVSMARDVDVIIVITPGGAATKHIVNKQVLEALGPNGIVINVARGSVIDENALIDALRDKKILSAGLDVFEDEPKVPQALIDMPHVVLLPHVGSASVHCRRLMGQLVVDNLIAWANGKAPLTPVAETPWPPKKK
ncbi:MAG: 2-hydroxyacid dehydrogenase [Xanthobacteraceae bacterium]|nr:2-hydroxyacid dehydrogenase [Xanthobacteraceae bacterium]QYK44682.1 MAG: 2-hydroxyacid dehydrogenase [Xanthobacteraceae bacterium]